MTLQKLMENSFFLYRRRNRLMFASLDTRIEFVYAAIKEYQDSIRKDKGQRDQAACLSRILSRIFCVAEHFHELPLINAMCRKYPATHCGYCHKLPCACPERRSEVVLATVPLSEQKTWSLSQWQSGLSAMYGARNRERGIANAVNRLLEEVNEINLFKIAVIYGRKEGSLTDFELGYALEIADAIAWTLANASVLDIELEPVMIDRYGGSCRTCKQRPCECTHHLYEKNRAETAESTFGG